MAIRKIIYSILFCCAAEFSFGQITINPSVESVPEGVKIERVEVDDVITVIYVHYTETHSSFLNPYIMFPSSTFLYDDSKELSSNVLQEIIGFKDFKKDDKKFTVQGRSYDFMLLFDVVPAGVEKISIKSTIIDQYGRTTVWFNWKGIKINNPLNITTTSWSELTLRDYYQRNMKDTREGIYEEFASEGTKYKLGLIKDVACFKLIFLSSNNPNEILKVGNVKAELISTADENLFKAKWIMANGRPDEDNYITFKDNLMVHLWADNSKETWIKLFPTVTEQTPQNPQYASSGTGFLISSEGYIVTNHHVIKDANSITVRGLNGDFNKSVSAKLVIEDINNDLAIIKTDEYQTPSLTEPPFIISSKKVEPGNSVFCLGYPLRATMGEEVKITNGIISSNSGFMGDITSYQISAPVQPGNSGGPLFDDKGNLVGIINAKHSGAENVSYAVKSGYLLNLINSASISIKLQQINKMNTLSLPEKIKVVKKYTYIIETNL
jgi:S1-C subfamily serine protease